VSETTVRRACLRCGHALRPGHKKVGTAPGTRPHSGRGLCQICWKWLYLNDMDALYDYPRITRDAEGVLADYEALRRRDCTMTQGQAAARLGMTYVAFDRAIQRARRCRREQARQA